MVDTRLKSEPFIENGRCPSLRPRTFSSQRLRGVLHARCTAARHWRNWFSAGRQLACSMSLGLRHRCGHLETGHTSRDSHGISTLLLARQVVTWCSRGPQHTVEPVRHLRNHCGFGFCPGNSHPKGGK